LGFGLVSRSPREPGRIGRSCLITGERSFLYECSTMMRLPATETGARGTCSGDLIRSRPTRLEPAKTPPAPASTHAASAPTTLLLLRRATLKRAAARADLISFC